MRVYMVVYKNTKVTQSMTELQRLNDHADLFFILAVSSQYYKVSAWTSAEFNVASPQSFEMPKNPQDPISFAIPAYP